MDDRRDRYDRNPRQAEPDRTQRRASSVPLVGATRGEPYGRMGSAEREAGRTGLGSRQSRNRQRGYAQATDGPRPRSRDARGERPRERTRDGRHTRPAEQERNGRHARPRDERRGQQHPARHARAPLGAQPNGMRQLSGRAYQLGQGRGRGLRGVGTKRGGLLGLGLPVSPGSLVTLAGGACAIVAISLLVRCILWPAPAKAFNGTGGIDGSPLFSGAEGSVFAASLVLPSELTPIAPGTPAITGTNANGGSALQELTDATHAIEQAGFAVGYAMLDLATGVSVSYNADAQFYSASSIKGPYVTSVVQYELGASAQSSEGNRISAIIESSDNAAYSNMRDAYGNSSFAKLVDASGAAGMPAHGSTTAVSKAAASQSGESIADNKYEFLTPNQMLALWRQSYQFLSSDEPGASWLASVFETPETSAIRVTAGTLGTTWSKAGWYPAGSAGYSTTVDAGVVRTSSGDVLIAIMTTEPENFAAVESVLSPLLTLRASLA